MVKQMDMETVQIVSSMANKLWADAEYDDLYNDFKEICDKDDQACFLMYENEFPIGFIHASTRYDYVEGSQDSPIGYKELASDCKLENESSIAFHKGLEFAESNRIVCFIKEL